METIQAHKNFALIGAAGYIAPRHMKAIHETGNRLIASYDPYDGIGVLDSYFPESRFFTEFERFDRYLEKLKYQEKINLDYVSIASPNYLHDAHIRVALRRGADAICEKPLVLNPWNLEALQHVAEETGKTINTILQLRLHPSIVALKKEVEQHPEKVYDIDLSYITSRGNWYYVSWKGDQAKSGGVATNIGVHFFDMLSWIFGDVEQSTVHIHSHDRAAGFLRLKRANVRWFLSIDKNSLPKEIQAKGQRTYRSISVDGKELEFSDGFTDLHTESYKEILSGNGYGIHEVSKVIELIYAIRSKTPVGLTGDYHPLAKLEQAIHPFKRKG